MITNLFITVNHNRRKTMMEWDYNGTTCHFEFTGILDKEQALELLGIQDADFHEDCEKAPETDWLDCFKMVMSA